VLLSVIVRFPEKVSTMVGVNFTVKVQTPAGFTLAGQLFV
jgi:hypothetical protein